MKKIMSIIAIFACAFAFALPEDSLFKLGSKWEDNQGKKQTFQEMGDGRFKVVTMIFTSCPSACPLMVKHIQKLDAALSEKQKQNVEYLLFSIDPLDQQEKLAAFHEKFGLDERFRFLRNSNESEILELAAVLGFKYKKIDESMYSHGTDVYLLNPQGQIIGKVGQSYKAEDLAEKISEK